MIEARMLSTRAMKIICSILCLIVLASNLWTMRNWTERTGVYDDICYLRQAHLFQRFGLGGIDTDLSRDNDGYFATLAREIGFADWNIPARLPCHTPIGEKLVIQYPPGTGFALSIFPAGVQRVSLYAFANIVTLLAALAAIWSASSRHLVALSGIVGCAALYFMINPAKSSFSMAPTIIVCAICGYLTNILANSSNGRARIASSAAIGLLLGLAVSFRLPNLFLSAGYFVVLIAIALRVRELARLAAFGLAYGIGLVPTLLANAINAGGMLKTTYGSVDAVPPDFSFRIALDYMTDLQGPLIVFTIVWVAIAWFSRESKTVAAVVIVNVAVNLAFFLSHPIFTPYYLMPLAILSLWTILFSFLNDPQDVIRDDSWLHSGKRRAAPALRRTGK